MTELQFKFWTELTFSVPVSEHQFALHCLPVEDDVQRLEAYSVQLNPQGGYTMQKDGFGNWTVCGSCREPHTSFTYAAAGLARVDLSRRQAEPVNPVLRSVTELTEPDSGIRALWQSLPLSELNPQAKADVLNRAAADALCYTQGVTDNRTTAAAALALGQGVCQDYAHLLLALARLEGFAARYCMGLIPGEGATHAWVELALPSGWVGYDPTHCCIAGEEYLRFATGRDAADCPAERGVFRGFAQQQMKVDMLLKKRV